jgi:hypothetical protein
MKTTYIHIQYCIYSTVPHIPVQYLGTQRNDPFTFFFTRSVGSFLMNTSPSFFQPAKSIGYSIAVLQTISCENSRETVTRMMMRNPNRFSQLQRFDCLSMQCPMGRLSHTDQCVNLISRGHHEKHHRHPSWCDSILLTTRSAQPYQVSPSKHGRRAM